jgi:hypothetical protein
VALALACAAATLAAATSAEAERDPACAACPAIIAEARAGAERAAAPGLCARLVGELVELGRYRAAFDAKPRYIDVFPAIYWQITEATVSDAGAGRFAHPIAVVQDVTAFLDAYETNRARWDAAGAAEAHWATHFRLAADADRQFGAIGQGAASETPDAVAAVLDAAIRAHVAFDLPRALRASFRSRFDPTLTEPELKTDFARIDASIEAAQAPSAAEIYAAVAKTSSWDQRLLAGPGTEWMGSMVAGEAHSVLTMRAAAWRAAFADAPLPTGDTPQPAVDASTLEAEGRAACGGVG